MYWTGRESNPRHKHTQLKSLRVYLVDIVQQAKLFLCVITVIQELKRT